MKFVPTVPNVRLVSARSFKSKAGNDLTFVKIADTATFESEEFMLSKDCDPKTLVVGSDYEVVINVEGKFTTVDFL